MRPRTRLAWVAVLLAGLSASPGCGVAETAKQPPSADDKASEAKASPQRKVAGKPTSPLLNEVPVTIEFLGLSADKEHARYRIHVNTDKPLEQADVGITYAGADGKEQRETVVWQNVVKSKRQPIERGKAYEYESYVGRGATGVVCRILHVVYKDLTTWEPGK